MPRNDVKRPNLLATFSREVAEKFAALWQTRVVVCEIVTTAPLTVTIDGTTTPAVGVAGLAYTAGIGKGIAFQQRQGLPVVLPAI